MVLHTWTRELTFHPHVHAIVSAGALSPDGVWLHSRQDYLFPVKVMARLFRRLFREALLDAIDAGQLSVVAEQQAQMRRALFETKWNVYAKAPFRGAEHAERTGLQLALTVDEPLPAARFDRDALAQVLFNLLDNALKYGRGGADRRIQVRCRQHEACMEPPFSPGGPSARSGHVKPK